MRRSIHKTSALICARRIRSWTPIWIGLTLVPGLSTALVGLAVSAAQGRSSGPMERADAGPSPSDGDIPPDAPGIGEVFPAITKRDLDFLHAERPRFARVYAAWRLKGQGKLEEAVEAARAAVEADPEFGPGIDAYVKLTGETDRLQDAETLFVAWTTTPTTRWPGWYGLAKVRLAQQAWEGALEASQRASASGCRFHGCVSAIVAAYEGLRQLEAGERYFRGLTNGDDGDPARIGMAWLGLGLLLKDELARRAEAEAALEQAAELLRPGRGWEAAHMIRGNLRSVTGDAAGALKHWSRVLGVARETGNRGGAGMVMGNLGTAYHNLGELRRGIGYLERSLAIDRERGDRASEGKVLSNLGIAYKDFGEVRRGIASYESALRSYRALGDRRREGNVLGNLGVAHMELGEVRSAIAYLEQALAIHLEVRNRSSEGTVLGSLGNAYRYLGEGRRALDYYQRALAIHLEVGNRGREAIVQGNMGIAYHELGDLRSGIAYYTRALMGHRAVGRREAEANVLGNLGTAYAELGDVRRGIGYYQQALTIQREIGDRNGEASALGYLGDAHRNLGEVSRAIGYYEQALVLQRAVGNRRHEGELLGQLGTAFVELDEVRKGLEYHQQALVVARQVGDRRREGIILGDLGGAQIRLGRIQEGIDTYALALAAHREVGNRVFEQLHSVSLARALSTAGDRTAALPVATRAVELLEALTGRLEDPDLEASYFATASSTYALQIRLLTSELPRGPLEGPLPLPHTTDAPARTFALGERARARSFHRRLQMAALEFTGDASREAADRVREATAQLNQARAFLGDADAGPVERAVLQAWLDGRLAPALERQKLTRSALPADAQVLQRQRVVLEQGTLAPSDRRSLLKALLEAREDAVLEAEKALRDASPAYARLTEPKIAPLEEAQDALDEHTVLLAYLLAEDESFAWAVRRTGARLLHLPPEKEIDQQVNGFRALLTDPERTVSELAAPASKLYQTLIAPAAALIRPGDRLVIVPDGSLGRLPFETLVADAAGRSDVAPAWLGLEHPVTYAPSATVWAEARRRAAPGQSDVPIEGPMLLVGDPVYHDDGCDRGHRLLASRGPDTRAGLFGETWPRLCAAAEEARRIAQARRRRLFSRRDDLYLLEDQASERVVRAQDLSRYAILHFTTHAVAWDDAPVRSAVVLSQTHAAGPSREPDGAAPPDGDDGDPADGYLDLREIMNLQVRAGLVVLSACQTAEGRNRRGEGVESLARGFLIAGAGAVLASQWQVADRSTAHFMGRLYHALKDRSAADALFHARRAFVLEQEALESKAARAAKPRHTTYAHPYYWAPFVLIEGAGPDTDTRQ